MDGSVAQTEDVSSTGTFCFGILLERRKQERRGPETLGKIQSVPHCFSPAAPRGNLYPTCLHEQAKRPLTRGQHLFLLAIPSMTSTLQVSSTAARGGRVAAVWGGAAGGKHARVARKRGAMSSNI